MIDSSRFRLVALAVTAHLLMLAFRPEPALAASTAILIAPEDAPHGAAVARNQVYKSALGELISYFKRRRVRAYTPEDVIKKRRRPRKKRTRAADWMRVVPEATRRVNYLVTLTVLNKVTDHGTIRSARVDLVAKLFRPGFEKAIAEIKQPATEDWPMKSNCYGRCIVQTMATKIKEPTKTLAVLILRAIAKHRRR